MGMQPGNGCTIRRRQRHVDHHKLRRKPRVNRGAQGGQPLPGQRRDRHRIRAAAFNGINPAQKISLVQHFHHAVGPRLIQSRVRAIGHGFQNAQHIRSLCGAIGVGDVAHMQNQISSGDFFQSGTKGFHQLRRQIGNETHSVGKDHIAPRWQLDRAHGGIKCGE